MPATPAVSPQPVPEVAFSAATAVPQSTVPPPAPPGASVQGAPVGLGARQLAWSGEPWEAARPAAPLSQQREVSLRRCHVTRVASLRTALLVASAPATPAAHLAPPRAPARHKAAGARAPHAHAAHPLPALPPALLGGPASHGATAARTQPVAVARDVVVPHAGEHGDADGRGTEAEQPGARGGAGNGGASRETLRDGARGDGVGGGDGPETMGTA